MFIIDIMYVYTRFVVGTDSLMTRSVWQCTRFAYVFSPPLYFLCFAVTVRTSIKDPLLICFFFSIIFRLFCCCCFCLFLSIFSFRNANVVFKIQKSSQINYALVFFYLLLIGQHPSIKNPNNESNYKKKYNVSWSRIFF